MITEDQRAVILRFRGQHGHEVSRGYHERCWEPFMENERKLREIFQEGHAGYAGRYPSLLWKVLP